MNAQTLSHLAILSGAKLVAGDPQAKALRVIHDTRQLQSGDLYVALKGEFLDGRDFIQEAFLKGAVGVLYDGEISEKIAETLPSAFGLLRAANSYQALQQLAGEWRKLLKLRVIMVTGSSGKTTTKDFTAAVLRSALRVTCTQGNLNNHIGLPLSMLAASQEDDVAVWEIGMNHRGEIAPLAALGKPDIAIITNIGTAHIGLLGSREVIAEEKGDLVAALSSAGVAILPAADDFCERLSQRTKARCVCAGIDIGDLRAEQIIATTTGSHFHVVYEKKSLAAFVPIPGRHMIGNALLALAAGMECGISLEQGIKALENISSSKGRLLLQQCGNITLIDDSYNANPDSMQAALATIDSLPISGRKIAVLGKMGELGDYAQEGYQNVGTAAATVLDLLITVGSQTAPLAQAARIAGIKELYEVPTNVAASELLCSLVSSGDCVLIKGSHSALLQEVVQEAVRNFSAQ